MGWLKDQTITETKGVFDDVVARVNGFDFVFGLGGIHGSVENEILETCDQYVIESWDVTSYYPNLAIKNGFYPQHLGKTFCTIYEHLFEQRKQYPKKSAESAMLKLALNGVYGDSNNRFSVFYDPLFTMSITLNGQLLLCMLAEQLMKVPTVQIVMANTDGLEYIIHPDYVESANAVCKWWQDATQLSLEHARYRRMFIRDCNNYIAEYAE
jgi:DNA polymerase elongation subunit (family B)